MIDGRFKECAPLLSLQSHTGFSGPQCRETQIIATITNEEKAIYLAASWGRWHRVCCDFICYRKLGGC